MSEAGESSLGRSSGSQRNARMGYKRVLRSTWKDLGGAGLFCGTLVGLRLTWSALLPLQAHNIGLDKQTIGFVVAAFRTTEIGVTLFSAGRLQDRYGRKVQALPTILGIGLAYALVPFCTSLLTLTLASLIYGVCNGLGGGIVLSFQTALAPRESRSEFLALWKMQQSLISLLMPPLLGYVSDATGSLEIAALCFSSVAVIAVVWLMLLVRDGVASEARSVTTAESLDSIHINSKEVAAACAPSVLESMPSPEKHER